MRQFHYDESPGAALLAGCVTPCMENLNNRCCMVPAAMAYLFPCCRELHCRSLGWSLREEGGQRQPTAYFARRPCM